MRIKLTSISLRIFSLRYFITHLWILLLISYCNEEVKIKSAIWYAISLQCHCNLLEYVSHKKYKIKNTISSYTLESYYLVLRSRK